MIRQNYRHKDTKAASLPAAVRRSEPRNRWRVVFAPGTTNALLPGLPAVGRQTHIDDTIRSSCRKKRTRREDGATATGTPQFFFSCALTGSCAVYLMQTGRQLINSGLCFSSECKHVLFKHERKAKS